MVKNKRGACMADGGITQQETPEQLMARMAAKYGAPTGATQQPQPQSTQQAPQQPPPKSNPLGIMSILKGRSAQIEKAVNGYADGGIAGHVKFEGKGGPRDDQIPVKVAGQKINVSDGEQALIIPAKTAANAQAMEMIKQIIADSNDGRQPDMGGGENFANGGLLDEEARKMSYQAVTGVQSPALTPQPVPQPVSGGISLGRSPAPTIYSNGGIDAATVQRGIDTMRNQLATPQPIQQSPPQPAGGGWGFGKSGPGATLQVTTGDAARLPAPVVQQGIATMRNQLATPQAPAQVSQPSVGVPTTSEARPWYAGTSSADPRNGLEMERERRSQASNEGVLNDPVKSALKYGVIGQPKQNSAAQLSGSNYGNEGRSVPTEITKDNPGAVARINSDQPAAPDPMMQDMPLTTKDIVPGGYSDRGAGIIASRNKDGRLAVSNVGTEGVADMSKGVMDDSASAAARHAADVKSGNTVQQVYERMLRNRLTADANDPTITDPAVRQQAVQGLGIMGNPAENQLKQAQAQGILAQTESAQMLADIQKKAIAGDPQALASYKALTQKGGADYKDRYITLPNRKVYNDMGQIVGEESGGLFDAATGKPVDSGAGGQKQQQQAVPPADKREVGKTYQTPKGPLIWRGNGWEAA